MNRRGFLVAAIVAIVGKLFPKRAYVRYRAIPCEKGDPVVTAGRQAFLREIWKQSPSKCFAATVTDIYPVGDDERGKLRPCDIHWVKDNLEPKAWHLA